MRRSLPALLIAWVLLLPQPSPVLAALRFFRVSSGESDAVACRVAAAPGGAVVIVWTESSGVWTRRWMGGVLEPPVFHGSGARPDIASDGNGFVLAFERDGNIRLRGGDGDTWEDEAAFSEATPLMLPRLAGWSAVSGLCSPCLCFQTDSGAAFFSERVSGTWLDPEPVPCGAPGGLPLFAQPVCAPEGTDHPLRVYAMVDTGLVYAERTAGGWGEAASIHPGEFLYGGEFAVAAGSGGVDHVLSNGPQPTCPCNVMHCSHGATAGVWSDPEIVSSEFDAFTWAQDPAIAVDGQDRVHMVWYQQHYDSQLEPSWEGLYYRVLDGEVWEDFSGDFCCQRGRDADLDLRGDGSPVIVWTQADGAAREVWLALDPENTSAAGPPPRSPALVARPNPFTPRTTLHFRLPAPAPVELTVLDINGRRVRTLIRDPRAAGEMAIVWDGRDDAGRPLASGIYLARLSGPGLLARTKLVLTR